ncbi:hypothetical protein [Leisingera methylohalidivorans]|uniref:hypothetical protein n=1 Tax=Leisingera methylohalidivorans TaxID=133924 RepID=UPI0003F752CF|nr:hypothetical protein [Leisingera methylohalidivorans]
MFPKGELAMKAETPVTACADRGEVKYGAMINPLLVESYKAFGATPSPLPWGEVCGGLKTNVIQGQESPAFFRFSTKIYEVTDCISYVGRNNSTTTLMAKKGFHGGPSPEGQKLAQKAALPAYAHTVVYLQEAGESALAMNIGMKPEMQVTVLNDEQRSCFKTAAVGGRKQIIERSGDRAAAIQAQMTTDLAATAK